MTLQDSLTKKIAQNAIVAAIYFIFVLLFPGLSYGQIQFRISEALVLLCFWRPDFIFGVTLGCFLANINSTLGPWDMLIGTAATFLSCLFVAYLSPRLAFGMAYPILINAFVVGFELWWLAEADYWASVLYVAIGETTVIVMSYILWVLLSRNRAFMQTLAPRMHAEVRW